MLSQRACVAESQVKNRLSNGPLRAQSNVGNYRVFCDAWACVSCRGYVGISVRAREIVNARWHRG
ncbi:MAG: hypothetical protein J6A73_06180 [Lachnospiraceae bacterium]|nr:hypothetical protein [Lachnospiraceae bacterium]